MDLSHEHLLNLAAKIVSAHIGNHETATEALPGLIREVYRTLAEVEPELATLPRHGMAHPVMTRPRLAEAAAPAARPTSGPRKAVAVSDTDMLTCEECGLTMKMLKRHLITVHGLTPEEYRTKFNLPADAPMVTAEYARLRSSLAKQSGLGKRPEAKSRRGRIAARG